MKKLLLASVAILALGATAPTFAQTTDAEDGGAVVGGAAGGATGAGVGFLLGGPIGAVVGGFAGAVIGAEAGVDVASIEYATANPVDPIYVDGAVDLGYTVPAEVTIYPIEGDPNFGYIYLNNRVWIVDLASRTLVQSPAYLVSENAATFAASNPTPPVVIDGEVAVGFQVPADVQLTPIPDDPTYSYIYVDDRPAIIDNSSRAIISIQ